MADEVLDLETVDQDIEKENRVEKRIKDLSGKLRTTSEELDESKRLSEEKDGKIANLSKENEFLTSFGDTLAKHPNAAQFKDEIKEKVLKGYSIEDATISTLASKGELNPEPKKEAQPENPAGGSAAINPPPKESPKTPSEMSRDEKRAALLEAEQKGDIYIS